MFTKNKAPADYIENLHQRLEGQVGAGKARPILLGRSILEPIDEQARIRAREGVENIRTLEQWMPGTIRKGEGRFTTEQPTTVLRDLCGNGGSLWTPHNPRIKWKRFPITYQLDVSSAPTNIVDKTFVEAALDKAFNTFNAAFATITKRSTPIMFKRISDPVLAKVRVRWQTIDGALRNLGRCYYSWWSTTGEMKSASINFDTADKWFISAVERCGYSGLYFDIQNIATHEIGHAIGLAHNFQDAYATMYPTSKAGETLRRSLGIADINAMTSLYRI